MGDGERFRRAEAYGAKYDRERQVLVDHCVAYRNLAIELGATPDQMQNQFDRDLCINWQRNRADADALAADGAPEAWDEVERLQAVLAKVKVLHQPISGCDCDRGCVWPSKDGCAPPTRCQRCQVPWPCPTALALDPEVKP